MPKGKPNARNTGEYKQAVIEDMRKNQISQNETATRIHGAKSGNTIMGTDLS